MDTGYRENARLTTALSILAYGQYKSTTFDGMLAETLPFFCRGLLPVLVAYFIASLVAECFRPRFLGLCVYLAGSLFCLMPNMAVTGAWGPAHVGLDAAGVGWFLLLLVVVVKSFVVRPRWPAANNPNLCRACGYDIAHGSNRICPECGTSNW